MLRSHSSIQAQRGFSMVEMLLTAFILAIGIMGLTMLQVMSLKGARGGKSLGTAVQVGESVMDQIESEGRLTWLNVTSPTFNPTALANLQFVNQAASPAPMPYTIKGKVPLAGAPDPVDSTTYFTVNWTKTDVSVGAIGTMSNFAVVVNFSDTTNPVTGLPINRQVVLTRSILHG
jgi:prepilin-type N-terminal cleavage/methylation domain-containing protein